MLYLCTLPPLGTYPGSLMTNLLSALITGFDHTIIIPDSSLLATFESAVETVINRHEMHAVPLLVGDDVMLCNLVEGAGTESSDGSRVSLEMATEDHITPSGRDVEDTNVTL